MAAARTMTRERWDGAARASTRASRGCSHAYGREVWSWSARAGGCDGGVVQVAAAACAVGDAAVGGLTARATSFCSIDNTTGHHAPME